MKSTLNIHWKDWCWSWSSNILATWCWVNLLEKTLVLGKIEGRRRRGWQRMRWLDGIIDLKDEFEQILGDSEGQGSLVCCSPWDGKESDMNEWRTSLVCCSPWGRRESYMTEWLNNNNMKEMLKIKQILYHCVEELLINRMGKTSG